MPKYLVKITETIVSTMKVEADNPSEAEDKARETYFTNVALATLSLDEGGCEADVIADTTSKHRDQPIHCVGCEYWPDCLRRLASYGTCPADKEKLLE